MKAISIFEGKDKHKMVLFTDPNLIGPATRLDKIQEELNIVNLNLYGTTGSMEADKKLTLGRSMNALIPAIKEILNDPSAQGTQLASIGNQLFNFELIDKDRLILDMVETMRKIIVNYEDKLNDLSSRTGEESPRSPKAAVTAEEVDDSTYESNIDKEEPPIPQDVIVRNRELIDDREKYYQELPLKANLQNNYKAETKEIKKATTANKASKEELQNLLAIEEWAYSKEKYHRNYNVLKDDIPEVI
ncbi:MAG: hypothetical protein U9O94_08505 [Nanoarchaeota archaeon]|nr:hypothetical protein [Nanoarchaeota archaeon]